MKILSIVSHPHPTYSEAMKEVIKLTCNYWKNKGLTIIAGIEARGFITGSIIANHLSLPFVPIRKKGKLPGGVVGVNYSLEYGEDRLEMQSDVFDKGTKVLLVDDLLATGGTLRCGEELINIKEGNVLFSLTVIELVKLNGYKNLNSKVYSLVKYND